MIIFNGISSDEVGLIVEHYPRIVFPRRKAIIQKVAGRNGDMVFDQEVYENYDQQYEVFLDSKADGGLEAAIPKIASWLLSGTGYCRLEDSYFPEFYRMAYVPEAHEFLSYFNEYGRGTLTFNCAPERYYKMGEIEFELQNGQILHNPSGFKARPILSYKSGNNIGNVTFRHIGEEKILRVDAPADIIPEYDVNYQSGITGYDHKAASYTFPISSPGVGTGYFDTKKRIIYSLSSYTYNGSTIYHAYESTSNFTGIFDYIYLGKETEITWDGSGKLYIRPMWWTV